MHRDRTPFVKLCFDLAEAFPSCSIAEMRRDAQETGGEAGNDRLPRGGAEAVHQAGNAAGGQRGAPGFQTRVQQGPQRVEPSVA